MTRHRATALTLTAACLLMPSLAVAGGAPTAATGCVTYTLDCDGLNPVLGSACGDGNHGVPKNTSYVIFGDGVVSAKLTSCKEGETMTVTQSTSLCDIHPFNDNLCDVELTLEAPVVSCPNEPATGCAVSLSSSVDLTEGNNDKDKLQWKWTEGPALVQGDFGDPVHGSSYVFCLYDGSALDLSANLYGDALRWKTIGDKGYKYKGGKTGIKKAKLMGGEILESSISLLWKNAPIPPVENAMTLQLIRQDGTCFESTIGAP